MKSAKSLLLAVLALLAVSVAVSAEGAKESPPEKRTLDVLWRIGGTGEYINPAIEEFKKAFPDVEVKLEYNPRAHEVLRPRLIAGNPPDVFQVNVQAFDFFGAIQEGTLRPLDDLMRMTPVGEAVPIGKKLKSDVMNALRVKGSYYIASDNIYVSSFLYDKTLFRQRGWSVPETWDELLTLCERIKREAPGIAPFAYPGMYPYYLGNSFFWSSVATFGGLAAIRDLNNLAPGFFTSDAVYKTAQRVEALRDRGYFLHGLVGLSHTETQMEFINRRVAMIGGGSWVFNEMKGNWPPDFELAAMVPPVRTSKGGDGFMRVSNSYIAIPRDARNPDLAIELLRILYSEPVRRRVAKEYTMIIPVENISSGLEELPPPVKSAFELLDKRGNSAYITPYELWYTPLAATINDQFTALVLGTINARQFCDMLEQAAEQVRKDPNIPKYRLD